MIPRTYIKFKWDDKEFQQNLLRIVSNLDTVTPLAIDEYGEILTEAIRSLTPRETGESQASIGKFDASLIGSNARPGAEMRARYNAVYKIRRIRKDTFELVVGSSSELVVWLNYGTTRIKGRHMFERGQVYAAQFLKPIVANAIGQSVRASGWITEGRWTRIQSHSTFNPNVGGGRLTDARRRIRISSA